MSKKTQSGQRKSLLTGASVLAAAAAAAITATPAVAQDTDEEEEAIVVTGTRLVRQDFEAISPITTVGSEQLELTATLTTDSLLNELPQIVPGNTRTSNNAGGEDFATVDLRGLGINRTLVLVNGERVPGSSTFGTVDINTIPASLISRIEVVTGGASAVYGSDAMAGVVNFVLKDDYEGAEVNLTYGAELETGNAAEFEINSLFGGNFANGRGNLTAYASYYDRDSVLQSEYDFSRTSAAVCRDVNLVAYVCDTAAEATAAPVILNSGGSVTPPWGQVIALPGNGFNNLSVLLPATFGAGNTNTDCNPATPGGAVNGGTLSFNDAGALTPNNALVGCRVPDRAAGSSRYNYAPDNYLIIPGERAALTTTGHYDISDDVRLNVLMNYTNSRTEVQLAPTPAQGLTITLTPAMQTLISTDHPDLWTALQSRASKLAPFVMNRRFNEVGTRNGFNESNAFYLLAGLEGSLGENWDWALGASYGQVNFLTRSVNSVNRTALTQGLAGCQDLAGNPLVGLLPGCVPLDIFGPNTLDDAMVSFLSVNTFGQTIVEENRINGYVRGDLFEMPAGPVAAVFGFEYRDSFASFLVDDQQRTGNIFGFNALQDQEGQIDVYELYTEFAVPLISEQTFAHYLGLEAGFRRSNYSSVGNVDTYKIGAEWAPTEWLRFRGVFNEATRAPNVFELFQNGDQGFPGYTDPCNDTLAPAGVPDNGVTTAAQCIAETFGLWAPGFSQLNSQVEAFAFGQPDLRPETAETLTYGFVFQPDWFPIGDLRATVDYYEIEITDIIAALSAQSYLNACYGVTTVGNVPDPVACARVIRDPVTGQVDFVNTGRANQGTLATEGYDIQLEWSLPIGPGQLTINELYSIIESYEFNGFDFVGTSTASIGGTIPEYKSVLSVSYNVGDWTLFGRWTYTPETFGTFHGLAGSIDINPEASYFDASVRWNMTDSFTLTANIDNVMDEGPPQTPSGTVAQSNTDVQVYRVLGRTFSISGRYRF
ncbi:MAG: hypothetical protein A4S17_05925 [Proteobacteria bacterium HN_bin10]|jgi:iron complex outermembrane receptor protein|nr:MAG: hypothetical protein A4S17_05925 [Proteobacteria bacterium HN_bin10]